MNVLTTEQTRSLAPGEDVSAYMPWFFRGAPVGYFADPGIPCITDVHDTASRLLESGKRVLILYMDGLGWTLYRQARLPFIKENFQAQPVRTVYPPLTQPAMASMLTGQLPEKTGIFSRRDHRIKVPSLLRFPDSVLIEADSELLVLEHSPVLTLPENGESADRAVLRAALAHTGPSVRLLIVHLHGLDDLEHDVGDREELLRDKLLQLDSACQTLCEAFSGTVILCADHGAHVCGSSGSHGAFDHRDMFVPMGVREF